MKLFQLSVILVLGKEIQMTSPRFIEACRFAALKHAKQRRQAVNRIVIPYVTHPLEAALILAECGVSDDDVLIAAVLHDTLEDTDTKDDDLRFKFGDRVLSIVKEVTDDPSMDRAAQKRAQVSNGPHKSYAAKLVKTADKTSNMRDIVRCPPGWSAEKVKAYAAHAREVVSAMNSKGELPPQLTAMFWQASQEILDWADELEFRTAQAL